MQANEYQKQALLTESIHQPLHGFFGERDNRILHAAIGIATEAGELLDPLKKFMFYNRPMDRVNLKEEIGDILWYIAIACEALETTIEEEMQRNINKLRLRYPNNFNEYDANNRNLENERAILEHPNQKYDAEWESSEEATDGI